MGIVKCLHEVDSSYDDVFEDFGLVNSALGKIRLRQDAVPYSVSTPPPLHTLPPTKKVETELQCMLKIGVIEELLRPTKWCALMVPVPKRNDKFRICIDLKCLMVAVGREKFVLPILEDIAPELADSTVSATLDAPAVFSSYHWILSPQG